MAKIILTHDVDNLGAAGDVVEVKNGYARNYLLPRNLATPWSKGAQRQIDQMRAARRAREIADVEKAREIRDTLQGTTVVVKAHAGKGGRLFGSVSTSQIASAVKEGLNIDLDRRKIRIENTIKSTGHYKVAIKLHPEVDSFLKIQVVSA